MFDDIRKEVVRMVVYAAQGNITLAAEAMGVGRTTLANLITVYEIPVQRREDKPTVKKVPLSFFKGEFKNIKIQKIIEALERSNGNRTKAALDLGISLRALRYNIAMLAAQGYDVPKSPFDYHRRK